VRAALIVPVLLLLPALATAGPVKDTSSALDARVKKARAAAKAAQGPAAEVFTSLVAQVGGKREKVAPCVFDGPIKAQVDVFRGHVDEDRAKEIIVQVRVLEGTEHPNEQHQCHWIGIFDCPKGRCALAHEESTAGTACLAHHQRRFSFGFSTKKLEDSSGLWIKRQEVDSCGLTVAVTTVQEALWLEATKPKRARLAEFRYCYGDECPGAECTKGVKPCPDGEICVRGECFPADR
jgi:hypothetical protein